MQFKLEIAKPLVPLFAKPKRIKIAVGGRGSAKSTGVADGFLGFVEGGERCLAAREHLNTIQESVHQLLKERISKLDPGHRDQFSVLDSKITSAEGGEIFYRGLARNPLGLQSMQGIKKLWVEEAQALSDASLDIILPTIRETDSEIWLTMNRKSVNSPVSRRFFGKEVEDALRRFGFYEDDERLIVQINYWQNPWFPAVLEAQRKLDKRTLSEAKYKHIWWGEYDDEVDNTIIEPDWFDACIDAHMVLGFKAEGKEVITHDPSDRGDPKGICYRKGSVILMAEEYEKGDVNQGMDHALSTADKIKPDLFVWDGGGIGASLRRDVKEKLGGRRIGIYMFLGQGSVNKPEQTYEPIRDERAGKPKKNKDVFANRRAQRYISLRDRCYRTYLAVKFGVYQDPNTLISFSSDIKDIETLRAQLCKIPEKDHPSGKIQIMDKREMMNKYQIPSPNIGDAVMMSEEIDARHSAFDSADRSWSTTRSGSWMG